MNNSLSVWCSIVSLRPVARYVALPVPSEVRKLWALVCRRKPKKSDEGMKCSKILTSVLGPNLSDVSII